MDRGFVALGALERLDTPDYLGSADATIKFDDFFPELTYRLAKYPTNDAELTAGNLPPSPIPRSMGCPGASTARPSGTTPI